MKTHFILMAVVAGCLVGCNSTRLSRDIVGAWQSTHFDAYGTPNTNAVVIVQMLNDGTWVSEVASGSSTNRYHGTYTVSGNTVTIASDDSDQEGDWSRYTYCNGILVSIAPTRRNIAIKMPWQNKVLENIGTNAPNSQH